MAHLQYTDLQDRPTEFLDLTSLTLDEFQRFCRKVRFLGKIQKFGIRNSMTYRLTIVEIRLTHAQK